MDLLIPNKFKKELLIVGILSMTLLISSTIVLFSVQSQPKKEPPIDPVAHKVTLIMKMFNCDNSEIYNAIMNTFDPVLVATVIAIESEYKVTAVSPAGARGLMQLTPEKLDDWQNVTKNIQVGAAYLQAQIKRFGNLELAIAAYNAGPGAVFKYQGIPPYQETINYVKKAQLFSLAIETLVNQQQINSTG